VPPLPFSVGAAVLATSASAAFSPNIKPLACPSILHFSPSLSTLVVSEPPLGVREELGLLRQTDNDHDLAGERS
jgi:hypothetical protein